MSRRVDKGTGFIGVLVFICVAFNIYAGYSVPNVPPSVIIPSGTKRGSAIPDVPIWISLMNEQKRCPKDGASDNFSFQKQVRQYLNSDATSECSLPQPTFCQSVKVSVVVLSEGKNMRTLFLSLLSFLSYDQSFLTDSPVVDISLVTTIDEKELSKDTAYGQRIQDWGKEGTIKIISVQSSYWDAMQKVNPLAESVLWINGDVRKDWTLGGIRNSHSIWRDNSNAMIASNVVQINRACQLPQLHNLMVPREFLCFLDHPLMDLFPHRVAASSFDVFASSIVLFWSILSFGRVLFPRDIDGGSNKTIDLPGKITSFFGCGCPEQLKFYNVQNITSTTCGSFQDK